jgi:hypothetical protein
MVESANVIPPIRRVSPSRLMLTGRNEPYSFLNDSSDRWAAPWAAQAARVLLALPISPEAAQLPGHFCAW